MLDTIRKKKNSIFGFVIIGFCSLLMVPFGLDMIRAGGLETDAVRIDDATYTMQDYYRRLTRWQNIFRQQLGQNYELARAQLNIEQRVVDEIVNAALLDRLSDSLGLAASMAQVRDRIASHPFFQGEITKVNYKTFLQVQGLSGAGLEQQTAKEIIAQQLSGILSDLNTPTESELRAIYLDSARKASFNVLKLQPSAFESEVAVDDAEALKSHFTDNAEQYRKPRSVRYAFIPLKASDFEQKVDVTNDDIIEQYEAEKHKFFDAPQVRLSKIVLRKAPSDNSALEAVVTGEAPKETEAQKAANKVIKERAEELRARLDAGEDFAAIAKESSEDADSKANGGDLGWLRYNLLENEIRTAAGTIEAGEHSEVIEAADSFQLIRIEEKKERRQQSLDEVRGTIVAELRSEYAPEYAGAAAEEALQLADASGDATTEDLEKLVADKGYTLTTTEGMLSRLVTATKYPRFLTTKALELGEGDTEIVSDGNDSYLLRVLEVKDSYIPEFAEVETQVKGDYLKARARILAEEKANALLASYQEAKEKGEALSLEALATESKLSFETTEPATRSETTKLPLNNPNVKRAAFTLSDSSKFAEQVFQIGSDYYLVELAKSVQPDDSDYEKNLAELQAKEETNAGARLTSSLISRLRSESEIWVNPEIFATPG